MWVLEYSVHCRSTSITVIANKLASLIHRLILDSFHNVLQPHLSGHLGYVNSRLHLPQINGSRSYLSYRGNHS